MSQRPKRLEDVISRNESNILEFLLKANVYEYSLRIDAFTDSEREDLKHAIAKNSNPKKRATKFIDTLHRKIGTKYMNEFIAALEEDHDAAELRNTIEKDFAAFEGRSPRPAKPLPPRVPNCGFCSKTSRDCDILPSDSWLKLDENLSYKEIPVCKSCLEKIRTWACSLSQQ